MVAIGVKVVVLLKTLIMAMHKHVINHKEVLMSMFLFWKMILTETGWLMKEIKLNTWLLPDQQHRQLF